MKTKFILNPLTGTFDQVRKVLSSNRTYYVDPAGSDTTGDGTVSLPFATIQHCLDITPKDLNGHSLTINLNDGSYTLDAVLDGYSNGGIWLTSTSADVDAVTITGTNREVFAINYCSAFVTVSYLSIKVAVANGSCINSLSSSYITVGTVKVGTDGIATGTAGYSAIGCISNVYELTDIDANVNSIGIYEIDGTLTYDPATCTAGTAPCVSYGTMNDSEGWLLDPNSYRLYSIDQTTPQTVVPLAGTGFEINYHELFPSIPGAFTIPSIRMTNSNLIGFSTTAAGFEGGAVVWNDIGDPMMAFVYGDIANGHLAVFGYDTTNFRQFIQPGASNARVHFSTGEFFGDFFPLIGGTTDSGSDSLVFDKGVYIAGPYPSIALIDTDTSSIVNVQLDATDPDNPIFAFGGRASFSSLSNNGLTENLKFAKGILGRAQDNQTASITAFASYATGTMTAFATNSDVVVGSDGNDYKCVKDHTATVNNCPVTGTTYATYWEATGTTGAGATWVIDTYYYGTNGTRITSAGCQAAGLQNGRYVAISNSKNYNGINLVVSNVTADTFDIETEYIPTAASIVVGTDGNDYECILPHVSTVDDRPVTGADWATYWVATGGTGSGGVWGLGTAYYTDIGSTWDIVGVTAGTMSVGTGWTGTITGTTNYNETYNMVAASPVILIGAIWLGDDATGTLTTIETGSRMTATSQRAGGIFGRAFSVGAFDFINENTSETQYSGSIKGWVGKELGGGLHQWLKVSPDMSVWLGNIDTGLYATIDKYGNVSTPSEFIEKNSATITRNADDSIATITVNGTRTRTYSRNSDGFVTSCTDGVNTWTYTRDADNHITSWAVT